MLDDDKDEWSMTADSPASSGPQMIPEHAQTLLSSKEDCRLSCSGLVGVSDVFPEHFHNYQSSRDDLE